MSKYFVSYTRQDKDKVRPLAERIRKLGHDVWLDEQLTGGEEWWLSILQHVRDCDAILLAISPAERRSEASHAEVAYGKALGKAVLPFIVEHVRSELLPPDLARIQHVDYTSACEESAFQLVAALASLPAPPPLPDPLPEPPPVPGTYMYGLGQQVQAAHLDLDTQLALVGKLGMALQRPLERDAALELLHTMQEREDLLHTAATQIYQLLGQLPPSQPTYSTNGRHGADRPLQKSVDQPPSWSLSQQDSVPARAGYGPRKNRVTAGVLALLLGGFGVHKFYLDDSGMGVLYLLFFWTGVPMIIGIVEGIMYLAMTDADFEAKYCSTTRVARVDSGGGVSRDSVADAYHRARAKAASAIDENRKVDVG